MEKPDVVEIEGAYVIKYLLSGESRIQIVNLEGGKSYQTIKFPAGTAIEIKLTKLPVEEKKNEVLQV